MSKITLLSQCLVDKYGITQSQANDFVSNMFSVIRERLLAEHIVKVKGLGTFKLAEMSARESININTGERITIEGRYKLSFTPENAVRDRINSPFAQFESIDLDEDMDFTDIDKTYPAESEIIPEQMEEPASVQLVENIEEQQTEEQPEETSVEELGIAPITEEPAAEPVPETEEPVAEEPVAEEPEIKEEPVLPSAMTDVRSPFCEELIREELQRSQKIMKLLKWLIGLVAVLLVCMAMFFVYNLGKQVGQGMAAAPHETGRDSIVAVPDSVVADTVSVPVPVDTVMVGIVEEKSKEPQLVDQDIYNKDARVRTGAYVIIGHDTTVTVLEGQTLKGISKAYLGDGMECYVEVYNDGITSVKPGDKVKIPRVMLKKRLRK